MAKKYDAVILDVDGTLWDSTPVVASAWTRAVQECGLPERAITGTELKGYFGKTMAVIAAEMLPEMTAAQRDEIMEKCCRYEESELREYQGDLCYPQVRETIRELAKRLPVSIVSNCQSGYIELFILKNQLTDCIADTECYGNNGLGKADNIRLLVERNGYQHPVYVGDTAGDLAACEEAGAPFIYASYGFGAVDETRTAGRIDSFGDLLGIL